MRIEKYLLRPLHLSIFELQSNEIPLQHRIWAVDIDTTDPHGFSSSIGKRLKDCQARPRPVVDFNAIESEFSNFEKLDLSKD